MFDREKAIEALIDDDFDAIIKNGSFDYLCDILRSGHVGYDDLSDDMLIEECEERGISYLEGEDE